MEFLSIHFYDQPFEQQLQELLEQPLEDEDYPYPRSMASLLQAISGGERAQAITQLNQLFALAYQDQPSQRDFKQLLSTIPFQLMHDKTAFIPIISQYQFTEYDLAFIMRDCPVMSMLHHHTNKIISLYASSVAKNNTTSQEYIINRAQAYIDMHWAEDLSITSLSDYLQLHPNYLSSLFKNQTGITYRQYVRNIRMKHAQRLLHDRNNKPSQIGQLIGYHDNSHFYRSFKECYGMTPAEYQNSLLYDSAH